MPFTDVSPDAYYYRAVLWAVGEGLAVLEVGPGVGCLTAELAQRAERVEAGTVSEVMAHIRKRYSKEAYREAKRMLIVVNGESIQLGRGYKTALSEGDRLSFLPICGGG